MPEKEILPPGGEDFHDEGKEVVLVLLTVNRFQRIVSDPVSNIGGQLPDIGPLPQAVEACGHRAQRIVRDGAVVA